MDKFIDMIGQIFDRLTVLSYHHTDKWGQAYWLCRCLCGIEVVVAGGDLRRGHSRSCGCLSRERSTTHGLSDHPLYDVWWNMNYRCNNPNEDSYHNYGGRSVPIAVCDRWHRDNLEGLANFIFDMYPTDRFGNQYKAGLSIERTENNLGYNAENCTWATWVEQNNNTRSNKLVILPDGEAITLAQLSEKTGIKWTTLEYRIFVRKWPIEKALTTPVRKCSSKNIS
jgi:hypothetical protein